MCIRDSHKEGVIRAVSRLVLGGQDELAAKETCLLYTSPQRKRGRAGKNGQATGGLHPADSRLS